MNEECIINICHYGVCKTYPPCGACCGCLGGCLADEPETDIHDTKDTSASRNE